MVADMLVGLCGAWGLAGSLTWSFARTRRAMLAVQISTAPGFILHWALQGHWTAAGMTVLTMLLALISAALDGPPDSRGVRLARALYLLALLPVAALAAWSWAGWHSLFAAASVACSSPTSEAFSITPQSGEHHYLSARLRSHGAGSRLRL